MSLESRSNSQDSDYELMQQYTGRLQRGHSIRSQPQQPDPRWYEQTHYKTPQPQHTAARATPPQRPRFSPNRWKHFHRLSSGRRRTKHYSGLKDLRRPEEVYAVPQTHRDTEGRRYDGFFQGSITEEEEESDQQQQQDQQSEQETIGSMVIVPEEREQSCSCSLKSVLLGLFLVLVLCTSLAGLGLAVYNKFFLHSGSRSESDTQICPLTHCSVTNTWAAHILEPCTPCINSTMMCKTDSLMTNITVS